eukprot:9104692-Pyramimonas_sp.AAC.1
MLSSTWRNAWQECKGRTTRAIGVVSLSPRRRTHLSGELCSLVGATQICRTPNPCPHSPSPSRPICRLPPRPAASRLAEPFGRWP